MPERVVVCVCVCLHCVCVLVRARVHARMCVVCWLGTSGCI